MGVVGNYFDMVKRETALPRWLGGRGEPDAVTSGALSSYDIPSVKDGKYSSNVNEVTFKGGDSGDSVKFAESDEEVELSGGRSKYWSIVATGAGLFSDGYVNNSIGMVITWLKAVYPKQAKKNQALSNIAAIAFVGTVVGQLAFGFFADHVSRKSGMIISTMILIIFSILAAGSWGVGMPEDPTGMFAALTVYRAILGVGIGGEYPAGSVACAETSQTLKSGNRNRWFILFTNFMIDTGFWVSAFVAWVLLYICGVHGGPEQTHGLNTAWRVLLGLGAIPPLSLLYLRVKFKENTQFLNNNFKKSKKTPYWLIIKRYGPRLAIVSLIWFIYDFCSYSFGIYSSQILNSVVPDGNWKKTYGWEIVFNLFYIPGSFLGAFSSDYFGPRLTLFSGTLIQGIVGFIMASRYNNLVKHTAPLVVAYGIFETLGEFGPGDNIGLICSKTSATAVRGRYYGIAAAIGKIGAFAGTYAFPAIAGHYGGLDSSSGQVVLLYVSSALCVFSAVISLFIPELSQECIAKEDAEFRRYLAENGYDVTQFGDSKNDDIAPFPARSTGEL